MQHPILHIVAGVPGKTMQGASIEETSAFKHDAKGDVGTSNVFTGNIAVTVIELLPNGNLLVSGEKQIAINQNTDYIRVSGVVNPIKITAANTVSSLDVADARIESKSSGDMDAAQGLGLFAKFFLSLLKVF